MTTETLLTELQPLVESVATQFGRRHWKHGADSSDFAQELYAWVIENAERIIEWRAEYEPAHFDRHMARCLQNECKDYGRDIKSQALGYERRDEFFYSRNEVKALLGVVFDPEAWLHPPQSDGRSAKTPAEGNNWATTLADIKRGFDRLSVEDQVLLRAFHEDDYSNKQLADAYGITEGTMSYRHDQAVKRLVNVLGGEVPKPARPGYEADPWRGRHAISNAQARAYQDNLYQETTNG